MFGLTYTKSLGGKPRWLERPSGNRKVIDCLGFNSPWCLYPHILEQDTELVITPLALPWPSLLLNARTVLS